MAYFNHAFKKVFIATFGNQDAVPDTSVAVVEGIVAEGVHVSELKNTAAPYALGPGVVGFFAKDTDTSIDPFATDDCCSFYIAGASIKLRDKQGPFHGGYQESHKSKIINPRFINKTWSVEGTLPSRAVLEIGGTLNNHGGSALGAVLTYDTLVGGTGYVNDTDVPTTGGTGTGLLVDITTATGVITDVAIADGGTGYTVGDVITITTGNADATITVVTVDTSDECIKDFYCGETYYLRVEVKGTSALRFANHNLYQTLNANSGCCDDPENPVTVDPVTIYLQWATQIVENPYLKDFIRPVLIVDGQSYFYDAATALEEGFNEVDIFSNAPATSTYAGMILLGAYSDTTFADCTFTPTDYYGKEPIQLYASEVDYSGDSCTFGGVCVVERCPGVQGNGFGEQKVRELIMQESYLQNFTHDDLRIREITQGTRVYEVLDRTAIYSSFFLLHSVPRYNNPSSTYDNDQYLIEIVGTSDMVDNLVSAFDAYVDAGCVVCKTVPDYTGANCEFDLPFIPV